METTKLVQRLPNFGCVMRNRIQLWIRNSFYFVVSILLFSCEQEVFVEPKSKLDSIDYASVFVDSSPAGASIFINDRNTGYKTPDTVKWLQEGSARVTLKKVNFWDTTFTLLVDKSKRENIRIDYFSSIRMLGNITCKSNPSGAQIYLNNQNTGKITPDTLRRLIPGTYSVKFDYPEFRKDSIEVTVKSMVTENTFITLEDTLDIISYAPNNSDFPSQLVNDITEDADGNIWVATANKGVVKYDGKKFFKYQLGDNSIIPSNNVNMIKCDLDNNIWIGFSNALLKYNGINWEKTDTRSITSIHIGWDHSVLVGTDRGGIIKYSAGNYVKYTNANSGLPTDFVTGVCLDKSGKIWAALKETGLGVYDGQSWIHLDSARNGLPTNQCASLALSNDGKILGVFYQNVIINGATVTYVRHNFSKYDGNRWNLLQSRSDYSAERNIFVDKKNGFWYGLYGIQRTYNNTSVQISQVVRSNLRILNSFGSPGQTILWGKGAFVDSKDNLWIIGGYYGLVKVKKGRWNY